MVQFNWVPFPWLRYGFFHWRRPITEQLLDLLWPRITTSDNSTYVSSAIPIRSTHLIHGFGMATFRTVQ